MSDFLDRLASKAIGSETALVPRLPSLFEPSRRAPILPLGDEGDAPSRGREVPAATNALPAAPQVQPTHAAGPAKWRRAQAMPIDPPPVSMPELAVAPAQRPSSAIEPASRSTPPPERLAAPSIGEHPDTTRLPSPVSPRQTRLAPARQAPAPPSACGSLRPAPTPMPVFAAPRAGPAPAPSGQAAARRAPAVPVASATGASSEPVVHVSIGRLEVRAAAATGDGPRRRDGPRPSSLDDYLRQRGDKGAR
ncbi:hypothetical protein ACFPPA_14095 [Rhodanobacter ginsengisoli]|uniref:Uncharacterized protein n=1 Tax=Rhodanobacter ginsengisoli TaxID=418646 RepID=A0ABW0QQU7_9GAMM